MLPALAELTILVEVAVIAYAVLFLIPAFKTPEGIAAVVGAFLILILATRRNVDFMFLLTFITVVNASATLSFWVGVASSLLLILLVIRRGSHVTVVVLAFVTTIIIGAGLLTVDLLSPPALSGTAGKAVGFAAGHLLMASIGVSFWSSMPCKVCGGSGKNEGRYGRQDGCNNCAGSGVTRVWLGK